MKLEEAIREFKINLKTNSRIVKENDLQAMETIELSYTGELIPVEEVEYLFDKFIRDIES